jgi:hypothetical protein
MLDSGFTITARGTTFSGPEVFKQYKMNWKSQKMNDKLVQFKNLYHIDKVEAGDNDPVWAGYDRGTFENSGSSADGSYTRKVTGPYYRAWKLVNGEWKCYHIVYMAFTCEGADCGEH